MLAHQHSVASFLMPTYLEVGTEAWQAQEHFSQDITLASKV